MTPTPSPFDDQQLQDYLDGILPPAQVAALEEQLVLDASLRERYDTLRLVHTLLQQEELPEPHADFTVQVMHKLSAPVKSHSLRSGVWLLSGVIVAVMLTALWMRTGLFDSSTTFSLQTMKLVQQPIPDIPVNSKWIIRVLMMLNLVVGWMVLDRMVLRKIFSSRHTI